MYSLGILPLCPGTTEPRIEGSWKGKEGGGLQEGGQRPVLHRIDSGVCVCVL